MPFSLHRDVVTCWLIVMALCLTSTAWAGASTTEYHMVDSWRLPGPTRWDYLVFDPPSQRLYITRGTQVDVVDANTKKLIATIPDTDEVHGVALAPDLQRGFTSNGKTNSITVFDLVSLRPLAQFAVGTKPDAIVYDAGSHQVVTANGVSQDLSFVDAREGTVRATVKLGSKPEFAVVDGLGHVVVNLEESGALAVVSTKDHLVTGRYDLKPDCDGPTGLAIDRARGRLFVSCHNRTLLVVNAKTGAILAKLPIGSFSDATAYDPVANLAFSSNSDGTLDIIGATDDDHYKVLQTVPTMSTARTMALDPDKHRIFLVAAETEGMDPPTPEHPHPRPQFKPDTFTVLVVAPVEVFPDTEPAAR